MVALSGPGDHATPVRRRAVSWLPYIAGLFALSAIVLLVVGALLKD